MSNFKIQISNECQMLKYKIGFLSKTYDIWSFGFHLTFELYHLKLCDCNRIKLAGLIATPALHTLTLIQLMGFFLFSLNRINGTDPDTGSTTGALFRIHWKRDELFP